MKRLFGLLILLVLVWLAWEKGRPWLESLGGSLPAAADATAPDAACWQSASEAHRVISATLSRGIPPGDTESWMAIEGDLYGRVADAESACGCAEQACVTVREALAELRAQLDDFGSYAGGALFGVSNPATREERIQRLLDTARGQLGG